MESQYPSEFSTAISIFLCNHTNVSSLSSWFRWAGRGIPFLSRFQFLLKTVGEKPVFQSKTQGSVLYLDCNRLKLTLNVLPSLSTTSLLPTLPYISFCFNYFLCLTIYAAQNMLHIFWGDNTCPEHHHNKFMVLECLFFYIPIAVLSEQLWI